MAISAPRYVDSRLPAPLRRRWFAWTPSIASLAFAAAIGLVLLMQSFSIEPGHAVSPNAAMAQADGLDRTAEPSLPVGAGAPHVLQQAVLGEQNANHSASLGSPLPEASTGVQYAALAPATFEPRNGETQQATAASPVPAVASSVAATPTPGPAGIFGCESHGPLYCVYEVQPGATLASIAKQAGLQSTEDVAAHDLLVASNRAALNSAADVLVAGEKLRIPLQQGILHTVISQETLSEIARRYGVKAEEIVNLPGNKISDRDSLSAGAEILVPNPTKLGRSLAVPGAAGSGGGLGVLSWPAVGGITSYFGPSHPLGVDIALMPGDRVTAAAGGTVSFSGGDPCCSYGLFVIIDHGNGMHTLYGHLSVLYVDDGEKVDRGEAIGLGGYTGFGTGPHLHFEVHVGEMLADPLVYLP